MFIQPYTLIVIFDGWNSYQDSLVRAITPLTRTQLDWRPAPHLRSAGEITAHISTGRIEWFQRMGAPGSAELARRAAREPGETLPSQAAALVRGLEDSWAMIDETLRQWTVDDLSRTYVHPYQGKTYSVSHQWTIWRILAHDLHHGGELAFTLGMQGIALPELGDLGGHLIEPPVVGGVGDQVIG